MSSTEMATDIRGALPLLRRPFTPAAVKWKIQVNPKGDEGKALVVAFIDARLTGERLNAVCPDFWSDEFVPVDGGLRCTLTLNDVGRQVSRSDVGWSRDTPGSDMGVKGLYSDAFKRAGVKFGIGVSIYALPQQWLDSTKGEIKKVRSGWVITQTGLNALRKRYADWLKQHGEKVFGAPLDHGDVIDAQGDAETRERGAAVEEDAATDEKATGQQNKTEKPSEPTPELVDPKAVDHIKEALILSTKGGTDVKNWLVAAGLPGDIDASLPRLTKDQGRKLYGWLKKARAEGATAEAA